jgi:FAD/FMN-containing dehydrogenase
MSDLIAQFAEVLDRNGVLTGDDVTSRLAGFWRDDPVRARAILRPADTAQVSAILRICSEAGQPVIAHGGLTGLVRAADTLETDVVLSLERMNRIEEIDTIGRTMTVQAGAPLQLIQDEAEKLGLMFPLDLGARGTCQIGGNASTNAGGHRVIRYGMARDNILGLEAVLADGSVMSSMNTMIKNNAGYDLKHLFIGTEGTLGIITRLVLRLREAPISRETAFVAFDSFDQVTRFLKFIDRELGGTLSAFEVMWRDFYELVTTAPADNARPVECRYPHYVLVESLGADQAIDSERFNAAMERAMEAQLFADAAVAKSGVEQEAMWAIRDATGEMFRYGPPFLFDVSIAIKHMDEYVADVKRRLAETCAGCHCFTLGHIGDGNIHFGVAVDKPDNEAQRRVEACVYEPLQRFSGSVSAEHGIGLEKKDYLGLCRSDVEIAMMRRLNQTFDPNGILNRNKIFDFEGPMWPS